MSAARESESPPPGALQAPAAARNREPIAAVLAEVLPERGWVLEIASGSGEHALHFARRFPLLEIQPSDTDSEALSSIEAWRASAGLANLRPPVALDVRAHPWRALVGLAPPMAVLCINMIHIAPFEACEALLRGTGDALAEGGVLVLYGPFRIGGRHTAPSNAQFDARLKARNPAFGVRDLEEVTERARAHGLILERRIEMPANNFSIVFRRKPRTTD